MEKKLLIFLLFMMLIIPPIFAESQISDIEKLNGIENNSEAQRNLLNEQVSNLKINISKNYDEINKNLVNLTKTTQSNQYIFSKELEWVEHNISEINSTVTNIDQNLTQNNQNKFWGQWEERFFNILLTSIGLGYALYSGRKLEKFINWGRFIQHATTYFNAEDWVSAREYFDKALKLKSKDIASLTNAGASLSRLKRDKDALPYYDKILEINPNFVPALNNKGVALGELERYPEAESSFIKALEIEPNDLHTLNNMGYLYLSVEESEYASNFFDRILEIEPNDFTAWYNKGKACEDQENFKDALFFYDKALKIDPNFDKKSDPDLKYHKILQQKGNALVKLERYQEAIASYEKALKLDSLDSDNILNLAITLGRVEKFEEASQYLDQFLVTNPENIIALGIQGGYLEQLGKSEKAIGYFDKALQLNPSLPDTLNNKGLSLKSLGKFVRALLCFDESLRIKPSATVFYNKALLISMNYDNKEESEEYFGYVVNITPQTDDEVYYRGLALVFLKDYQNAIIEFDKLLVKNSSDNRILRSKSGALHHAGRYDEAITILSSLLEKNPTDIELYIDKGIILGKSGRYERAIESCFDYILKINPHNMNALYNKGTALFKIGKFNQALDFFDRALEINPKNIPSLYDKASCLVELGKISDADNLFDKIIEIDKNDSGAMFGKSIIYAKLGNYQQAWNWWYQYLDATKLGRDVLDLIMKKIRTSGVYSIKIQKIGDGFLIQP